MKDYYNILGVTAETTTEAIKEAFRNKVAILHPEKNKADNAKEIFADLIEAYEILSKTEKRKAYDTLVKEKKSIVPIDIKPEVKEDFKKYEKEAKETSKKYRDHGFDDFLALELFVGMDILDSLFDGADDILGDIFDIF